MADSHTQKKKKRKDEKKKSTSKKVAKITDTASPRASRATQKKKAQEKSPPEPNTESRSTYWNDKLDTIWIDMAKSHLGPAMKVINGSFYLFL